VLIFGFGPGKAQDLGEVVPHVCPSCHNRVFLHHVRSKKAVRLYFVPVVPYGTEDYLLCPVCEDGIALDPARAQSCRTMQDATSAYRRGQMDQSEYDHHVSSFRAYVGLGPLVTEPPRPAPTPAPPAPDAPPAPAAPSRPIGRDAAQDWLAMLGQLDNLHRAGVLTDEDLAVLTERVLNLDPHQKGDAEPVDEADRAEPAD
jgi:hypothetical protein